MRSQSFIQNYIAIFLVDTHCNTLSEPLEPAPINRYSKCESCIMVKRVVIGLDNIVITDRGPLRAEESDEPRIKNQFLVTKKPPLFLVITGPVIYSRFSVPARGPTCQGHLPLPMVPLSSVPVFVSSSLSRPGSR